MPPLCIVILPSAGLGVVLGVVTASSGGRTFCFWSDLVPTVHHTQPTWVAAVDLDPIETIDQKQRWLARAADEDWICGFSHDPHVGFARIERDERRGFRVIPV